jgi:hypothetical protein
LVADMMGRGDFRIPVGSVNDDQAAEQAAQFTLPGLPGGLPIRRCVAVDEVQMRRRKVITHIVVTAPLTEADAARLAYRDPRAELRALPTGRAIAELPQRARERALLGLQALAIGVVAYLEDGVVQCLEAVPGEVAIRSLWRPALTNSYGPFGRSVHDFLGRFLGQ